MNEASNDREGPVHSFLSPEAVRLDLPVSGPAPRMLAYGIDLLTMIAFSALLFMIISMTLPIGAAIDKWIGGLFREAVNHAREEARHPGSGGHFQGLAIAIFLLTEFVISTGYFIFWEMVTGGRSPGKMLVGLRVVRRNGLPIDLRSSLVRNLMRAVDIFPAEYLVGLISILLSSSGEHLGDHIAGTIVLRLDRPETAAEIPRMETCERADPDSRAACEDRSARDATDSGCSAAFVHSRKREPAPCANGRGCGSDAHTVGSCRAAQFG